MSWKIVERKIGKAGNLKQRQNKQRAWDKKYEENWMIGYVVNGTFISQEDALEQIYYKSYQSHFENNPADIHELITVAKKLVNPHAKSTGNVDLQVPAIMKYLDRNNLELTGNEVVDIGSYGERSHKISVRLSPLTIKVVGDNKMTLEKFWQKKKCLAIWEN